MDIEKIVTTAITADRDTRLEAAIEALGKATKVDIKGKKYTAVATRVEVFRRHFGLDYALTTEIIDIVDNFVRVRAKISQNGTVIATGMAEENRQQGAVNRTSALENCETSAIGRCLAAFGLHGGEFATAEEVSTAIAQQEKGADEFAKTNLKARAHELVRDINACADLDSLIALQGSDDFKHPVNRMKSHYTEGYDAVVAAGSEAKAALEEREAITLA